MRYEDTEHYAVTKAFLQNPAGMLRRLFADVENDAAGEAADDAAADDAAADETPDDEFEDAEPPSR